MLKKIFIFSSFGLALLLFLGGIYKLAFNPSAENSSSPSNSSPKSAPEKTAAAREKLMALTDDPVLSPTLDEDGSALKYYSLQDRGFYKISFDGQIRTLILKKDISDLANVLWSPDKKQAILKTNPVPTARRFLLFDFSTQKETALSPNLDDIFWQNNNKIIYQYFDPAKKERTLNIADPDGRNWKKIADLNFTPVYSAVIPQSGLISFWNKPDAYTESFLQSTSLISNESQSLLSGKFGADFLWSPDGNRLLTSHSNERAGKKIQLAVMNNNGGEYKNLEIPTLTVKCAWSKDNKTIYYALPAATPENTIWPNDYFSPNFHTTDTFWKVNILTGEKTRLIDLNKINVKIDAIQPFLNADESLLFFINRIDRKLYQLRL